MRLVMTVLQARSSRPPVDVAVATAPGAVLASVADEVRSVAGATGPLTVAGVPAERLPLGAPPLLRAAVLTAGAEPGPGTAAPLLELQVRHGPDAGASVALGPGEHTVGRAAGNRLRLTDERVDRVHCVVRVDAGGVVVRSTTSAPTSIDGRPVSAPGTELPPGSAVELGDSVIALRLPEPVTAPRPPDGGGHLLVTAQPGGRVADAAVDVMAQARGVADGLWSAAGVADAPLWTGRDRPLDLRAGGTTTVRGARAEALGTTRWLLAQLVVRLPPGGLRLGLVAAADRWADWRWARWLPHLADVQPAAPATMARFATAAGDGAPYVVVLDAGAPGELVQTLAEARPPEGLHLLVVGDRSSSAPGPAGDRVSAVWAERLARTLAPLRLTFPARAERASATVPRPAPGPTEVLRLQWPDSWPLRDDG